MTRADLTTCGRNIFPSPNKSPTTFIPSIKGPSITFNGLTNSRRAASVSSMIKSKIPFTKACSIRLATGADLHASLTTSFLSADLTVSAKSSSRSVASSLRSNNTSSTRSNNSLSISAYTSSMVGLTIPISIPCCIAWYRKAACMASRTGSFPRKENETLLTPPLTLAPGKFCLIQRVALKKSTAFLRCSSIPVATGKILGSKMMSWWLNFT